MAKYTIISDIGKGIISMLRDKLVPDPVDKSESIGICDPKERGGYIVGIHPYDIKEDTSGRGSEETSMPDGSVKDPPAMIELYYVISVCSKAEPEAKALDEAKIIGKIIQIFKDNPNIPPRYMPDNLGAPVENVPISMLPLNMEEKVKIWTMFGESYKLSVFYVVGPIAIDSENIHKPKKRVETIHLGSSQYKKKRILEFETRIKEEDIDDEYTERPDEDEDEDENEDEFDEDSDEDSDEGDSEDSDEGEDEDSLDDSDESLDSDSEEDESEDDSSDESGDDEASEDDADDSTESSEDEDVSEESDAEEDIDFESTDE